jgi:hypothetical protein
MRLSLPAQMDTTGRVAKAHLRRSWDLSHAQHAATSLPDVLLRGLLVDVLQPGQPSTPSIGRKRLTSACSTLSRTVAYAEPELPT